MNKIRQPHFLDREMQERGINSPWDLREDDQWVNDATRQDIEALAKQVPLFGLKHWEWKKLRGDQLKDVKNFEIDLLFRVEDEPKVDELIRRYTADPSCITIVDRLSEFAIYFCLWV